VSSSLKKTKPAQFKNLLQKSKHKIKLLSQEIKETERESKLKSAFLANVSHEIRTPMNGILGMVDLLSQTPLTQDQKHCLSIIESSGQSLLALLNDILDLSRIEAGKLVFEKTAFQLKAVVERDTLSLLKPLALAKKISLEYEIDLKNEYFIGDPHRLRQILTNLVSNAIKFTQTGKVKVKVQEKIQDKKNSTVRFEVEDTGAGIPTEFKNRIFQPFEQVLDHKHAQMGSGLGLAISQNLVEQMDGKIGYDSKAKQGTLFYFEIPFKISSQADPSIFVHADSKKRLSFENKHFKCLLVEDNALNREITERMLKNLSIEVVSEENGEIAIEKTQKQSFDFILMDCQMPIMDGYETTRTLRKNPDPKINRIPIIALTAYAMKGDAKRCQEAGMDNYLSKPLRLERLHAVLESILLKPRSERRVEITPEPAPIETQGVSAKLAQLLRIAKGDLSFVQSLVEDYTKKYQGHFQLDYPWGKDFHWLHDLKTDAGNLGATDVQQFTEHLYSLVRHGKKKINAKAWKHLRELFWHSVKTLQKEITLLEKK